MSDLKLFKLASNHVTELTISSMALEKFLQSLVEKHLDMFLGITFLASEYSTGPKTGGRMNFSRGGQRARRSPMNLPFVIRHSSFSPPATSPPSSTSAPATSNSPSPRKPTSRKPVI